MSALSDEFMKAVSVSKKFVAGLDRSALGRFSVPVEKLLAMDVFYRVTDIEERLGLTSDKDASVLFGKVSDDMERLFPSSKSYATSSDWDATVFEMLFWWRLHDDDAVCTNEYAKVVIEDFPDELDRVALIHSHPSMHEYFAVGIWDTDFIVVCMADGIDAEMAATL